MVRVAPLATGVVFIALFVGFELKIPAITNLLPGAYAGLSTTGYIGLGFLLAGISSLGAAFSGSRHSAFGSSAGASSTATMPDVATLAAAMAAAQSVQMARSANPAPLVCAACGRANNVDARFCQGCAAPLASPPANSPGVAPPPAGAR